jgi:hypothetical protein
MLMNRIYEYAAVEITATLTEQQSTLFTFTVQANQHGCQRSMSTGVCYTFNARRTCTNDSWYQSEYDWNHAFTLTTSA